MTEAANSSDITPVKNADSPGVKPTEATAKSGVNDAAAPSEPASHVDDVISASAAEEYQEESD